MDGLGEQVVERFKLSWRLQHRDFGPPAAKDQAARAQRILREEGQGMVLAVLTAYCYQNFARLLLFRTGTSSKYETAWMGDRFSSAAVRLR